MSAREQWESQGFRSSTAMVVANHLRRNDGSALAFPSDWIKEIEARAIAEFVGYHSATSLKASGEACREMSIVACARFGVEPVWFYTDDDEVDELAVRALRADVAHYRILYGLDEE